MLEKTIRLLVVLILAAAGVYIVRNKVAGFYNNKGVSYYEKGDCREAAGYFTKSLEANPNVASVHYNLANAYREVQQDDLALPEYKKAFQLDAGDTKACRAIASIYYAKEMYQEALLQLKECAPASETNELAHTITFEYSINCLKEGVEEYLRGNKIRAYDLIRKAIKLKYGFSYSHYTLGYLYYNDARGNEAIEELEKAIAMDYGFWPAHKLLGDIYFSKGDYRNAIEKYKIAVSVNSKDPDLFNDVGLALMQIEEYAQAAVYLKEALRLDQGNHNIRYNLASVYRDGKMFNEALSEYMKLIEVRPDYPNVHNDVGNIYKQGGRKHDALNEFYKEISCSQQKLALDPDDLVSLNNLAFAYGAVGEYDKAGKIINKVLSTAPAYRQAYLTLASILELSGRYTQALQAFDKARALSTETNFIDRSRERLSELIERLADRNFPLVLDKVYLKNGRKFEGVIKEENEDKLILELNYGRSPGNVILYSSDVERLEKGEKVK
jgi:tetratricopeptide (TPR) repeat protein